MAFHRKYPEKFSPESILAEQGTLTAQYQTLPIYCSNVCLRFLPVSVIKVTFVFIGYIRLVFWIYRVTAISIILF